MFTKEGRSSGLDGLRGIAATLVIFYHAILHHLAWVDALLYPPIQTLTSWHDVAVKLIVFAVNGDDAVLLFFVLSGFVLKRSWDRTDRTVIEAGRFIVRRFLRLYPALFFCMAVYYLMALICAEIPLTGFPTPDLWAAISNASLLQITWHGPSTTIQAEMLAIPFLLAMFFFDRAIGISGPVVCCAVFVVAFNAPILVGNLPNMHMWLAAFGLGVVVADRQLAVFFSDASDAGLVLLLVALFSVRLFAHMTAPSSTLGQILLSGALVGFVYYASDTLRIVSFLNTRTVQFLGRISYSLYLINVPILYLIWSFTDPLGLYETAPLITGLSVGMIATLITLPIASFSERFIERPGVSLGKITMKKKPESSRVSAG